MENILDKLRSLRSSSSTPFVSMSTIDCNVKMAVLEVSRLDTRYMASVSVIIQLRNEVSKVFLPKRFSELTEEDIEDMRKMTNSFQKSLFKLVMNSIYGKTGENSCHYNDIVISVSEDEVLKNLQKTYLRQFVAISPSVVIFQFSQRNLHLNKFVYAGFSILEMSKIVMYEFFYKQVRRVFPDARAV